MEIRKEQREPTTQIFKLLAEHISAASSEIVSIQLAGDSLCPPDTTIMASLQRNS